MKSAKDEIERRRSLKREITVSEVQGKIYRVDGRPPFMLDRDLAELYETKTSYINRAVKRNKARFPDTFIFQLTEKEADILVCQSVITKQSISKATPYGFTREGANMLSTVLHTEVAIDRSVQIIKAFSNIEETKQIETRQSEDPILATMQNLIAVRQKQLELEKKQNEHDKRISLVETDTNEIKDYFSKRAEIKEVLPDVKPKTLRGKVSEVIRSRANRNKLRYDRIWNDYYKEVFYRYGIDLKRRAKNATKRNLEKQIARPKRNPLDIAEGLGMMPDLLSLAVELYG